MMFKCLPMKMKIFYLIGFAVKQVVADKTKNIMLSAEENGIFYDAKTFAPIAHLGAVRLIPRLSCIPKFKLYQMDVKGSFLNRYLNVEVNQDVSNYVTDKNDVINKDDYVEVYDDIPFVNMMKTILEKATQEKDHVVDNVNDNINKVVDDYVGADKGYIPKNNEVHDRSDAINDGVTKYVDLSKRFVNQSNIIVDGDKIPTNVSIAYLYNVFFHYEESMLKWKYFYHKRITLERKLSKEALSFEEVVQLLEDVIVKDNENIMRLHMYVYDILDKTVEHFFQ